MVQEVAAGGDREAGELDIGSWPDSVSFFFFLNSILTHVITERELSRNDITLQIPLVGPFGSSLRKWVLVSAVFDRLFWSFRLDCKLPKGRD